MSYDDFGDLRCDVCEALIDDYGSCECGSEEE